MIIIIWQINKQGGLPLNHAYSRAYTPVLRNPYHYYQKMEHSFPANYLPKYTPRSVEPDNYHHYSWPYSSQSQYITPTPLSNLAQSYSYPSTLPRYPSLSQIPLSSYPLPTFSYAPTVSYNGLAIILIATLILVALDLVIVRPQKMRG